MAERIRVLYVITGLATGGAQLHAIGVAGLLPRGEFEPGVFSLWREGEEEESQWERRLQQAQIPLYGFAERGQWRRMLVNLWRAVSTFRPHLIHSHSEREDWLNALLCLVHPLHPRAVRTVHIDQQWRTAPHVGPWIDRNLFPYLFTHEVAVSDSIRQLLLRSRHRHKEKVSLCYNGMDEDSFLRGLDVAGPLPEGVPPVGPRLGIVGRLTEQKGHGDLLAALVEVRRYHPAQLIIVGSGPLLPDLQAQVRKLGLSDAVHFLGFRQDVPAILPHFDLFVLPSYWEGFPTALLEAMALGVPVIATDVSGNRELVLDGQTGRLVPPGNRQALADTIVELLSHQDRSRTLAEAARERAAGFTIQKTALCYATAYQRIVQER